MPGQGTAGPAATQARQQTSAEEDPDEDETPNVGAFFVGRRAFLLRPDEGDNDDDNDAETDDRAQNPFQDANAVELGAVRRSKPSGDESPRGAASDRDSSRGSSDRGRSPSIESEHGAYQQVAESAATGPEPTPVVLRRPSTRTRILRAYRKRIIVLAALFVLQSASSGILQKFERLINQHIIITLFLTCLVGAGGNAGSQAVIAMVSQMVTRRMNSRQLSRRLGSELIVGALLAVSLALLGFLRAWFTVGNLHTHALEVVAIALSLFAIVLLSVLIGTCLPFFLQHLGLDPQHASPIIQVTMDILGVITTCNICSAILPVTESG